jgi:hypothetical protein
MEIGFQKIEVTGKPPRESRALLEAFFVRGGDLIWLRKGLDAS